MPTHFTGGVSDATVGSPFYDAEFTDPTRYYRFFDDFTGYLATDWIVTEIDVGTGDTTQALTDGAGGQLLLTNAGNEDDGTFIQTLKEPFLFVAGKKTFFKARFQVSDATQTDVLMGLHITDTTPMDASDGTYFFKADGSTTMNLIVKKDTVATTTAAVTVVAATWYDVAYAYDGASSIKIYVNNAHVGTSVTTNLCDDEALAVGFGLQNGSAAAHTALFDYIFVAQER